MINIASFILSIASLYLFKMFLAPNTAFLYNHFFYIFIACSLYVFYKNGLRKITKKRLIYALPFSLLLSALYVIGNTFDLYKTTAALNLDSFIYLILLTLLLSNTFMIILDYFDSKEKIKKETKKIIEKIDNIKYKYIKLCIIFTISMIPTLLALYPGVFTSDQYSQLMLIITHKMSAHHPIIHTFIIGLFYNFGKLINNVNLGIALLAGTQIISLAIAFTYNIYIMKKNKVNIYYILICILFFIIAPLNGIIGSLISKDSYFAALFLLVFGKIVDITINNQKMNKKDIVFLIIISILFSLFRNQGVYVLIFFLIFSLIFNRKKELLICITISIISFFVINSCLITFTNAKKSNMGEMLSLPLQQVASVVVNNPNSISRKDLKTLYKLIPKDKYDEFIPYVSDPIKRDFNEKYFKKNFILYTKLWIKIGINNKRLYLDEFLYENYGYWYIDINMPHWNAYLPYDDSGYKAANKLGIKYQTKFKEYEETAKNNLLNASFQKYPIMSTLLSTALGFVCLVVVTMITLYDKKYKFLPVLSFILGLWGTVILGPIIGIRYAYPLIIVSPLLISTIFMLKENR